MNLLHLAFIVWTLPALRLSVGVLTWGHHRVGVTFRPRTPCLDIQLLFLFLILTFNHRWLLRWHPIVPIGPPRLLELLILVQQITVYVHIFLLQHVAYL